MNALVVVVCRVYAVSMAALSRRLGLATVCSRRLIVSATWVTCSVLVVAAWLLPLLDAGVPGVSSEKTFVCSHPSLCLSTWGVVCLALMCVVQCYMVRKLGPWLPPPFTDCAVTIVLWSWICGVKPSDDPSMDELHAKLGICDLAILVRERRLRWFGHVMRSNGEINRVRSRPVPGRKGPGRPKKTWEECVKQDLKVCGLSEAGTQDRLSWRSSVKNSRQEPTPSNGSLLQSMAAPPARRLLGMRTRSFNKTGFDWLIDQMLITLTNPTSGIGILHLTKTCWQDFGNTATTRSRWGLKKIMVLPHPRHNTSVYRIHRQFSTAKMRLKRGTQRFSNMVQSSQAIGFDYWYKHTFFPCPYRSFQLVFVAVPESAHMQDHVTQFGCPFGQIADVQELCVGNYRKSSGIVGDSSKSWAATQNFVPLEKVGPGAAASEVVPYQNFSISLDLFAMIVSFPRNHWVNPTLCIFRTSFWMWSTGCVRSWASYWESFGGSYRSRASSDWSRKSPFYLLLTL